MGVAGSPKHQAREWPLVAPKPYSAAKRRGSPWATFASSFGGAIGRSRNRIGRSLPSGTE